MRVIYFNGPPGAGKSHMAKDLLGLLASPTTRVRIEGHIEILRWMLIDFAERQGIVKDYVTLKNTEMFGHTGREWQIAWADAMREKDPFVFVNDLDRRLKIRYDDGYDFILVDDLGFPNELNRIFTREFPDWHHTIVYLEKRVGGGYSPGELFQNDNRTCFRDRADLIDPSLEEIVKHVTEIREHESA